MHESTRGVVLRSVDYKEADRILTLLTPEGKRTVKARGCRRRSSTLGACSQLLVYSNMVLYSYQDRLTLSEGEAVEQFWGVRQDVEKLSLASYFAEVTEAVAQEGVGDGGLLSLLLNSLYALDKLSKPLALVKAAFELKLLCLAGFEPMADACAVCGVKDPEDPRLNLREGVLHCAACPVEEGISMPLDALAVGALRHIAYGDPKRLFSFPTTAESLGLLSNAAEAFLLTQLERGFRTLDFYKQITLGG